MPPRLYPSVAVELLDEPYARKPETRERAFRRLIRAIDKRLTAGQSREIAEELLGEASKTMWQAWPSDDGINSIAAGLAIDLFGLDIDELGGLKQRLFLAPTTTG